MTMMNRIVSCLLSTALFTVPALAAPNRLPARVTANNAYTVLEGMGYESSEIDSDYLHDEDDQSEKDFDLPESEKRLYPTVKYFSLARPPCGQSGPCTRQIKFEYTFGPNDWKPDLKAFLSTHPEIKAVSSYGGFEVSVTIDLGPRGVPLAGFRQIIRNWQSLQANLQKYDTY